MKIRLFRKNFATNTYQLSKSLGKIFTGELSEEDTALHKKLAAGAASRGTKIIYADKVNPGYLGTKYSRKTAATLRKGVEKNPSFAQAVEDHVRRGVNYQGNEPLFPHYGTDAIVIGRRDPNSRSANILNSSVTLAHEMGHSDHTSGRVGGIKGKIGKTLHDLRDSSVVNNVIDPATKYLVPIASGAVAGRKFNHKDGFKKNLGRFGAGLGVTLLGRAAAEAPKLGSEYLASNRAMELLKGSGASKDYLKAARSGLWAAGKTYLVPALKRTIKPMAIYAGTYGLSALGKYRKDKEKKERK